MCYILIKNYLERCFINNIIASNWKNVEKQEQITVGQILSRGVQFTDSPENSNVLWQAPPHASHIYSMVKKIAVGYLHATGIIQLLFCCLFNYFERIS